MPSVENVKCLPVSSSDWNTVETNAQAFDNNNNNSNKNNNKHVKIGNGSKLKMLLCIRMYKYLPNMSCS